MSYFLREIDPTGNTPVFDIVATLKFLRDWLVKHIMQEDMQYSTFLKERGA